MSTNTQTGTLTEFVLARIGEDEAVAGAAGDDLQSGDLMAPEPMIDHVLRWLAPRVLAECEAKRRIVELHHDLTPADMIAEYIEDGETWEPVCEECAGFGDYKVPIPCPTLRLLALPYADHPDYREEWRPRADR